MSSGGWCPVTLSRVHGTGGRTCGSTSRTSHQKASLLGVWPRAVQLATKAKALRSSSASGVILRSGCSGGTRSTGAPPTSRRTAASTSDTAATRSTARTMRSSVARTSASSARMRAFSGSSSSSSAASRRSRLLNSASAT